MQSFSLTVWAVWFIKYVFNVVAVLIWRRVNCTSSGSVDDVEGLCPYLLLWLLCWKESRGEALPAEECFVPRRCRTDWDMSGHFPPCHSGEIWQMEIYDASIFVVLLPCCFRNGCVKWPNTKVLLIVIYYLNISHNLDLLLFIHLHHHWNMFAFAIFGAMNKRNMDICLSFGPSLLTINQLLINQILIEFQVHWKTIENLSKVKSIFSFVYFFHIMESSFFVCLFFLSWLHDNVFGWGRFVIILFEWRILQTHYFSFIF